jgi:hypothetical protein
MDENKPAENNDGDVINVKVIPPEEASETSIQPASLIPTVEAAGDPPADQPSPTPEPEQTPEEASPPEPTGEENEAVQPTTQPAAPKSSAPIAAIVAAVVVAIGLAVITVVAYMKQQDSNKPAPAANSTQQDTTAEDLDAATQEIDEALKASDDADFSESELSDQNLGL